MAIADPTDAVAYVRAIRMIVGGYGAYTKEKRRETDVAVREEVARAANRIRRHLENIHDSALQNDQMDLLAAVTRAIEEADMLRNSANLAESGADHPFFSIQKSTTKKMIGKLVRHDHATLTMTTQAVRLANQAELTYAVEGDVSLVRGMVERVRQKLSSCQGHFSQRLAVLRNLKVI